MDVLFGITELSLDVILNQACNKIEESQNGYYINGNGDLGTGIVEGLLSYEEQRQSFSKVQEGILRRINKQKWKFKDKVWNNFTDRDIVVASGKSSSSFFEAAFTMDP